VCSGSHPHSPPRSPWVGGSVANNGARDLLAQQAELEAAKDLAAARTAARLLVAELAQLDHTLTFAAADACWWKQSYAIELSAADRKELAARLPPEVWTSLADMFNLEGQLAVERVGGFEWRPGRRSADMELVLRTFKSIATLTPSLSRFAGIGPPKTAGAPRRVQAYRGAHRVPRGSSRNFACRSPFVTNR
jgi:hypothetical protein